MTHEQAHPNLAALVSSLMEKTKAGKLNWEQTAHGGTFIVSVGGQTTLKLTEYGLDVPASEGGLEIILSVLDERGGTIWDVYNSEVPALEQLYALAERKAKKIDEKLSRIQALIETVQKL